MFKYKNKPLTYKYGYNTYGARIGISVKAAPDRRTCRTKAENTRTPS
jgi:hypothetical protein